MTFQHALVHMYDETRARCQRGMRAFPFRHIQMIVYRRVRLGGSVPFEDAVWKEIRR